MDFFSFSIGFLFSALLITIIFYYIYNTSAKRFTHYLHTLHEENRAVEQELTISKEQLRQNDLELVKLRQELSFTNEKVAFLQETKKEIKEEFEHIAREVIEQKSNTISEKQQESLKLLLTPFSENIRNFQQKVESFYMQESKERFSLVKEIFDSIIR